MKKMGLKFWGWYFLLSIPMVWISSILIEYIEDGVFDFFPIGLITDIFIPLLAYYSILLFGFSFIKKLDSFNKKWFVSSIIFMFIITILAVFSNIETSYVMLVILAGLLMLIIPKIAYALISKSIPKSSEEILVSRNKKMGLKFWGWYFLLSIPMVWISSILIEYIDYGDFDFFPIETTIFISMPLVAYYSILLFGFSFIKKLDSFNKKWLVSGLVFIITMILLATYLVSDAGDNILFSFIPIIAFSTLIIPKIAYALISKSISKSSEEILTSRSKKMGLKFWGWYFLLSIPMVWISSILFDYIDSGDFEFFPIETIIFMFMLLAYYSILLFGFSFIKKLDSFNKKWLVSGLVFIIPMILLAGDNILFFSSVILIIAFSTLIMPKIAYALISKSISKSLN